MGRGRRSAETVLLDSGLPPAAASPTRPRTSPRPNRGGRAAAHRPFRGFPDEPSSLRPPETHGPNAATLAPTQRGGQDRLEPKPRLDGGESSNERDRKTAKNGGAGVSGVAETLALICAERAMWRHALACASVSRVLLCRERTGRLVKPLGATMRKKRGPALHRPSSVNQELAGSSPARGANYLVGSISRTVWRKPFTLIGFAW